MTETTQPDPQVEPTDLGSQVRGRLGQGVGAIFIRTRHREQPWLSLRTGRRGRWEELNDIKTLEPGEGIDSVFLEAEVRDQITPLTVADIPAGQGPSGLQPTDTRPGLNADHLPFLAHLIEVADQAGVTVVYCCLNADWSVMTSPELDDEAGAAFLAALRVGDVGEPDQKTSRTILAGPEFDAGSVRLYVRPIPTEDPDTGNAP